MDTYTLIMEEVIRKIELGKTVEEIFDEMVTSANKEFNCEVDFSFLFELLDEYNMYRLNTYDYLNAEKLEEAFINTLKTSNVDLSNSILINAFRTLAKSDKLMKVNDIVVCAKLDLLISILNDYKNRIFEHKQLSLSSALTGGIATYPNNNITELITPRKRALDEALYLNSNDKATRSTKNILNEFQDDPYSIDFSLNALQFLGKDSVNYELVAKYKVELLFNIRNFLNASLPLKENDFFKSAQISLISLYRKNSLINKVIGLRSKLSNSKILHATNIIMEHYLSMPRSSADNTYFAKPVQLKSYFFSTPIYEFRTESNLKLHPVFEEPKEQANVLRLIS